MDENKALSLYIHIPYCISKCSYCDFFSRGGCKSIPDEYVDALCREIKVRSCREQAAAFTAWKTVYIGGGTPSLLTEGQLEKICNAISDSKSLSQEAEFTIEVNPDDLTHSFIEALKKTPVNRISVGIQSLNEKSLSFAKRRASAAQNISALECISKNWKGRFSLDLICGLPYESEVSFLQGLEKVISYNPDHISMYSLTFEEETPFGKMLDRELSDYDFDFSDKLWLEGRKLLKKEGYSQYEVSNFSKAGFESLHNLSYWNHQPYLGCGSGATGSFYDGSRGRRITNTADIEDYCSFWNTCKGEEEPSKNIISVEEIDEETSSFEFFMMGLRKLSGVKESDYFNIFSKKIPDSVKKLAEKWQKKGLCQISDTDGDYSFTLGEKGILYLNSFVTDL